MDSENELTKEDFNISEEEEEESHLLAPEEIEEEIKFQMQLEKNK